MNWTHDKYEINIKLPNRVDFDKQQWPDTGCFTSFIAVRFPQMRKLVSSWAPILALRPRLPLSNNAPVDGRLIVHNQGEIVD
jgi:hypothetical protein